MRLWLTLAWTIFSISLGQARTVPAIWNQGQRSFDKSSANFDQYLRSWDLYGEGISKPIDWDPVLPELVQSFVKKGMGLDLKKLYHLLPYKNGETKYLGIYAWPTPLKTYRVLSMEKSPFVFSPLAPGQIYFHGQLEKPHEENGINVYEAKHQLYFDVGKTDTSNLLSWGKKVISVLKKASTQSNALEVIENSFPKLYKQFRKFVHVDIDHVNVPGGVKLLGRFEAKREELKKVYPDLLIYLNRLSDLAEIVSVLKDDSGKVWGTTTVSTEKLIWDWSLALGEGHFIPLDGGKVAGPQFLTGRPKWNGELDLTVKMRYQGIKIDLTDYRYGIEVSQEKNKLAGILHFSKVPKIQLGSNAFTFIPILFAKKVLGVEEKAVRFFEFLAKGRNGKASHITSELANFSGARASRYHMRGELSFADDLYVRIGFKMLAHRLYPSEEQWEDMSQLAKKAVSHLRNDYQSVRSDIIN